MEVPEEQQNQLSIQAISMEICMMGSWIHESLFSGCGQDGKPLESNFKFWELQIKEKSVIGTCIARVSLLGYGMHATSVDGLTCQQSGTDCKDLISIIEEPEAQPRFLTQLNELSRLKSRELIQEPEAWPRFSVSLAKITRVYQEDVLQ